MIKTETIIINEKELIKTSSDCGFMIECEGLRYSEAIDLAYLNRTYTETDEHIQDYSEESTEEDYLNALAKLGVK